MNSMRGKNVLIAGGNGLIGVRLTTLLTEKGYAVKWLDRNKNSSHMSFFWDPLAGYLDKAAIPWADYIVNLAGSPVTKRWSRAEKRKILTSRIQAVNLISKGIHECSHHVKAYVGASAIGIYGDRGKEILTEDSLPASDFLAGVCSQWEAAAAGISKSGIRTVILRIGIVLSSGGGALKELLKPLKFFAAPYFGEGSQMTSWVHMDDVCGMVIWSIENTGAQGVYNATAPVPVTNRELARGISRAKEGFHIVFSLPPGLLKAALGDRASMVLGGQHVSALKITDAGYVFKFPANGPALQDLVG